MPPHCILLMMSIDTLHKLTTIVCLGVMICLTSCKPSKTQINGEDTPKSLSELALEKYGAAATIKFNKSKSHALVSKTQKDKNAAFSSVHFLVYEESTGDTILEDFINQGKVVWLDNNQIKVTVVAGMHKENDSAGYLFDVVTGKRTSIKN